MKQARPQDFAATVARWLEFAGYGPAVAHGPRSVRIHFDGALHTLAYLEDGTPAGLPARLRHQNPPLPEVQAVFSTIHALAAQGDHPAPLDDAYTVEWESGDAPLVRLNSIYAWLVDPARNLQLVLHELEVGGVPLWHRLQLCPYDATVNDRYYPEVAALLEDFRRHGAWPEGLDAELFEEVLDDIRKEVL